MRNHGDHPEKFDFSRLSFQGHSRSLELHTDLSATYDFLLVFYSIYGPISYLFSRQMVIFAKFPTHRIFKASAEKVPLGIL